MSPTVATKLVVTHHLGVRSRDLADDLEESMPGIAAARILFDRACKENPDDEQFAEARSVFDRLSRLGTEARALYAEWVELIGPPAHKPDNRPTLREGLDPAAPTARSGLMPKKTDPGFVP